MTGISETGAAGPGGNAYGDASGHTCIAIAGPDIEMAMTVETASDDRVANIGPPEIQVAPQWFTRREADLAPTDVEGGA